VQAEPPEGFVATPGALQAQVTDGAIEAVQFTVRDVGSKWTSTRVTHKLRHKDKDVTVVTTPAMIDGRNNKK
jgi:phage head maturation protease